VLAGEELGDVGVIAVGVTLGHQGSDLLADRLGQGPWLGAIAVAMDQRGSAVLLIGGFEAPDLAFGDTQELSGFEGGAVAGDEAGEDPQTVLLVRREGNG
jgi:hypothetical protein